MTTRGQRLLQKLYERDGAASRVTFTPANQALKIVEAEDHGVTAFIQKYEATRPEVEHMSETKQSIWRRIETAAAATPVSKDEDGIPLTPEQATSAYLEAHPDQYQAWVAAPWAETVQKSEDLNTADYHLAAAVKKLRAERRAGLEKLASDLQAEADAKTAKATKGR